MNNQQSAHSLPAAKVSVIVPCRNEVKHIHAFLDSLLAQETEGLDIEILVADGMSDDGTRAVLDEYRRCEPRIRVIDNPGRIVSTGMNAAIRAALGEIIIRMDGHTEYAPDYIRKCVEHLRRTGADNVGGPARTKAEGLIARAVVAAYHSPFSTGGAKFHDESYEGYVDTVPYGCWDKKTLERLGAFDEELVRNQDDELNLRILRSGGKIWQSPEIVSWYRPRGTFSSLFRQYVQYGFWKVAVIRKHLLPASWRHLVPGLFILGNAVLITLAVAGFLSGARTLYVSCGATWILATSLYASASLAASFLAARRYGWDLFPVIPLIFLTYHTSYGLGFILGLLRWPEGKGNPAQLGRLFTQITR